MGFGQAAFRCLTTGRGRLGRRRGGRTIARLADSGLAMRWNNTGALFGWPWLVLVAVGLMDLSVLMVLFFMI
jgi:hypothetical protein